MSEKRVYAKCRHVPHSLEGTVEVGQLLPVYWEGKTDAWSKPKFLAVPLVTGVPSITRYWDEAAAIKFTTNLRRCWERIELPTQTPPE